jgi:hypothetical protein
MLCPLRRDQPELHRGVRSVSRAKKAAAFLRVSRTCSRRRFSRRRQRSSSRSSVVRPSRRPESTSRRTQLRSDRGDQPSSAAICGIEWPELRTSSTATPELERLRGTGTWH